MVEEEKKSGSWGNTAGMIGAVFGMGLSQVLGMTLFIPIAFGFLAFFVLVQIDKRLKAKRKAFGGLGIAFSEDIPFKGLVAIEFGHVLWGVLGIGIYLSGAVSSSEIQLDASNFVEGGIYLILVVLFVIKPNWLSILLLVAYHCAAIYGINASMDALSGFSKAARNSLERGYITHSLFHGLALCGFVWISYTLLLKGRNPVAVLKSYSIRHGESTDPANVRSDACERLARLQELRASELISDVDFEKKKAEILKGL